MKRLILSILLVGVMSSMTAYAGQWQQDDKGYWYQNDDGTYKTGWHQDIDGKWYYLDDQSGYMLVNTTTPDGYLVDENGVWIEGGIETVSYSEKTYDNKAEFQVTAYSGRSKIIQLGYSLPVTVFYNNKYENDKGHRINISSIEVSKDGLLCMRYSMNETGRYYELNIKHKYIFEDGSFDEYSDCSPGLGEGEGTDVTGTLLWRMDELDKLPTSAEVYIDMGNTN